MQDKELEEIVKNAEKAFENRIGYGDKYLLRCESQDGVSFDIGNKKGKRIIDFEQLGIEKGSLSDQVVMVQGNPFYEGEHDKLSHDYNHDYHRMEKDVITMFGGLFQIEQSRGYVTSGGTEGNFQGFYWHRMYLTRQRKQLVDVRQQELNQVRDQIKIENQNEIVSYQNMYYLNRKEKQLLDELDQLESVILLTNNHHTHYSVKKAAHMLNMKVNFVKNMEFEMDIQDLVEYLSDLMKKQKFINVLVNCNIGSTINGGIDNVPEINRSIKRLSGGANDQLIYSIHMDGAAYGPILPFVKPFGEVKNYLSDIGASTMSVSMYKFLGVSNQPSGILITDQKFLEQAYGDSNVYDITFSQKRNGFMVANNYNFLKALKLDESLDQIKQIYDKCVENKEYFKRRLKEVFKESEIENNLFHFTFPRPPLETQTRYQLMISPGNRAGVITFIGSARQFIDNLIEDLKINHQCQ